MGYRNIRLSTTEIAGLWGAYINDTMSVCFLRHLLQSNKDEEIKPLIEKSLALSLKHKEQIIKIFDDESFPIPRGFTDSDIDLSAPPLFYDPFALSFVYGMSRIALLTYGIALSNVARADCLQYFSECLSESSELYKESVEIMLNKGIYDRPPKIPYPEKVEFIDEQSYKSGWFGGDKRPLNTIELTEIFFNIERNYFGLLLVTGFLQVLKDKEIKSYVSRGKYIAEKQIKIFNELLVEDDLLGTVPVTMEVTDSTYSPFSNKLIMFMFGTLNANAITYLGHGFSVSMRRDLGSHYTRLMAEISKYAAEGLDIMIERGWMEQPPQAFDRKELIKS